MTRWSARLRLVSLCLLACVAVASLSLWLPARRVHAGDLNGDGRPDSWRVYDGNGRLSQLALDSNFDGLADVREYYDRGVLVRRDSDRDFNDQVDLIQNFDARTRQILRAVTDVDFDGTGDLLVLFQDGQPVYSKWAHQATPVAVTNRPAHALRESPGRTADAPLLPVDDPFLADLAVTATHLTAPFGGSAVFVTPGGMPTSRTGLGSPLASSSNASRRIDAGPAWATVVPHSPRGPPSPSLHS